MQVRYKKFFDKLKIEGYSQKEFKEKSGISSGIIDKLLHNKNVNVDTICRICDYFHCMPDEIMEFIPDTNASERQKKELEAEKAEYEKKINEIQKKIDCLN